MKAVKDDLKTIARRVKKFDKRKGGYLYSVLLKLLAAYDLGYAAGQKNKP